MHEQITYFRARHVATMSPAGVIDDGCLAVANGVIRAAGPTRDVKPPRVDVDIDGLLTPGLINAHTHLELTNVPRPAEPGTFQNWLLQTMGATRAADAEQFARNCRTAVRDGVAQCLEFGVTTVGDISQNVELARPVLLESQMRAVSFGECLGLGARRQRFDELLARAVDGSLTNDRVRTGVSPHSFYTVEPEDYARALRAADSAECPVTTHLAETTDEGDFLDHHGGAFGRLYAKLGFDPGPGSAWQGGVIEKAGAIGVLGGMLLAHMNYLTADEISLVGSMHARVVWCPRTHAYFGHPPHPWRQMIEAGVTVCIGTDSCASSGDLNLMDDLRLIRRQWPTVDVADLWSRVTIEAAKALFADSLVRPHRGSLTAGEPADVVAWPTRSADPLAEVLDTAGLLPEAVWIGGRSVSQKEPA